MANMKRVKMLLMSAMLLIMAMSFTSCEDDVYYDGDELVGVWELDSDEYGIVGDYDVDKYRFNYDGTGTYGYYDNAGRWISDVPFVWSCGWDGPGSVSIDFGRNGGIYYYYYQYHGRSLTFSEDPGFRSWLTYYRVAN